jgi:acyl-CoA dehydrogenase
MLKQARWSRFADGADEVHQMTIARGAIGAWQDHHAVTSALGDLPL